MINLTKMDFINRYLEDSCITMTIEHDRIIFFIKDSWDKNHDIVKFVAGSDNCFLIKLDHQNIEVLLR